MKQSAGTLLYRRSLAGMQLLLVHPSGNYNRHKPWSIPKGIPEPGEGLEQAARRETREEAGLEPGELRPLGSIVYSKSGKEVHAFAGPAPDAEPRIASWEVDRAEFVGIDDARRLIHPEQAPLIDRLQQLLAADDAG
jgi:predicted NUDIX family NTP pyrophosphohydrolase